jgi:hypothetical protein
MTLCYTFDDWHGVVNGILHCQGCDEYSVIRLLDWGGFNLRTRIFSLACLPADSAWVFLRNMNSDYCDLTRKQDEAHALYHCLNPVMFIVAIELPDLVLLDKVPKSTAPPITYPDWRVLSPDQDNSPWFALFDL